MSDTTVAPEEAIAHSTPAVVDAIAEASTAMSEGLSNFVSPTLDVNREYEGICVLGSHPETVSMAPFKDERWLIYACSPHNVEHRRLPRWDAWFEVHLPIQDATRSYHYLRTIEEFPVVYVRDPQAMHWFKGAVEYPEKQYNEIFGDLFSTSSIAYIMMKAINDICVLHKEGCMLNPKLSLFGIMQASQTEYSYQRPGIHHYIQLCQWLGIDVICPEQSRLFEPQEVSF